MRPDDRQRAAILTAGRYVSGDGKTAHGLVRGPSRYRIVGPDELDLKLNLISIDSPLARALVGKALDAEVRVQTPTGEKTWYVVAIDYP